MNPDDPGFWEAIITAQLEADPEFWTREHVFTFQFKVLNLMALHGVLCLGLRHPGAKGHTFRPAIELLVKQIGQVLVELGALSPEQLAQIEKTEAL